MNRICLAMVCACTLLLGGCLHTSKTQFPKHYTLTTAPSTHRQHPAQRGRRILQIDRIMVPTWLRSTNMYYQLGYRHDARISAYGRSDWVAPPATLLEHVVESAISSGGRWRAVVGPGGTAHADVGLRIRLDQFSQYFAQPGHSSGVIEASATLVDNHDDSVIAQKHFRIKAPAPTADAAGGVKALNRASQRFAARLQDWLRRASTE